ncbi:26S proteasome regulatory complex, subunit RPN5/PSMD12, putative [Ixodes scapularis]|uniref:26S proteasome regulatory complex, subunit RPN5/PSMD12, putative n=1 Tax=Ixodes scapularis TaxID=6945 RepID=B7P9W6_IXOSC|nr:26S proteasome regulatory complex, subunit RPN5/PSMD12, putative [Ixodes scapularis]|eukprot:XP_002405752.1 26S proteasome regulatory complex, subunit RPN5/PSMD12, putative [Ixodes scapularis]
MLPLLEGVSIVVIALQQGKLKEALDTLLSLEKQTRTGGDTHSTSRVLVTIVRLCFESGDWAALNEQVLGLTKRRSQMKQAVAKMVQECLTYIDKLPDKETQLRLIDTLRTVTAGKIYVEVERARLTHKLAQMKEAEGNVAEAATIMQELQALKKLLLFLVLSPHDNEQHDLLHRTKADKRLDELPQYQELLKLFLTPELINWRSLCQAYEAELRTAQGAVFAPGDEMGERHWKDFKSRVVEHNIRVMAQYYTRITLQRMSQLLDLSEKGTEELLSELVVAKRVWAKVDRLDGVVSFSRHQEPNEVLNDWSRNLNSLMALLSKTSHLISKEEMIHRHLHPTGGTPPHQEA